MGMKKTYAAVLLCCALLAAPLLGVASAQPSNASLNQPSYYEGLGYGTCSKTENPGDPYVLGAPPAGRYWSLLVLKAGSAASNDDWNTMVQNPTPGPYVHPSGKNLSHVITCHKPGSPPVTTTTVPGSSTTVPGGDCDEYTPTQIAVDPPTASPGDAITITGVAKSGDTLTATMNGKVIGTGTADAAGQFSITATVPSNSPIGTRTITITGTECPSPVQVDIVVYALKFSGCGVNNEGRTFVPGQRVVWTFHNSSYDTSRPVELSLSMTGFSTNVYGRAVWPASNQVEVTIPLTAPTGKYSMDQIGVKTNGRYTTKSCPVWVENAPTPAASLSEVPPQQGVSVPLVALMAVAVAVASLTRLGIRRRFR